MNCFKVLVGRQEWDESINLLIEERMLDSDVRHVVTSMNITKINKGALLQPSITLDKDAAQQLFNGLWQEGFRPKDGTGNAGHLSSIAYHLEDMRRLVFKDKK